MLSSQRLVNARNWKLIVTVAWIAVLISFPGISLTGQNASAGYYCNEDQFIDSPHNYPNNFDRQYVIDRPGASQIKILFERIDTEQGYDFIYVKSKSGAIYNTYSGSYDNVVTNWIPGTRTIIQFHTDGSVVDWGFHVSQTNCEYASSIESPHNYPNNYDNSWWVEAKNSTKMRIYFEKVELEQNCDVLRIYDPKGNIEWTTTSSGTWIYSPWMTESKVRIRLTSDYSITYYGFKVSGIFTALNDDDNKFEVSFLAVNDYKSSCSDLKGEPQEQIAIERDNFMGMGYLVNRDRLDSNVRAYHFGDSDDSDMVVFSGHGYLGLVCLEWYNSLWHGADTRCFDHNDADGINLGSVDLEWYVFFSCYVLGDKQSHLAEFLDSGAHMVLGYYIEASIPTDVMCAFFRYVYSGATIHDAFWYANHWNFGVGAAAWLHETNLNDHLWGQGVVYPDTTDDDYDLHRFTS